MDPFRVAVIGRTGRGDWGHAIDEVWKGIDGTEAARRILASRDVPVVFVSSHNEPAIVAKTEGISSYGYVVKSAGITVLDAAIKMQHEAKEAYMKAANKAASAVDSAAQNAADATTSVASVAEKAAGKVASASDKAADNATAVAAGAAEKFGDSVAELANEVDQAEEDRKSIDAASEPVAADAEVTEALADEDTAADEKPAGKGDAKAS